MEYVQQHCSELQESLNRTFTQLLREFEQLLPHFSKKERLVVDQWLKKLRYSEKSTEEMAIRNDILTYMVNFSKSNSLKIEPFNFIPPSAKSLKKLKYLLPSDYNSHCSTLSESDKSPKLTDMLNHQKFVSELPVPRNGTFYIMVLRSKLN